MVKDKGGDSGWNIFTMQVSFRTERECVLIGLKDLKGRVKKDASVTPVDLDSFCEESDEIVNKIREVSLKQESES